MIIQGLLDLLSHGLAGLFRLIPPLPNTAGTATGWVDGAASYLLGLIQPFGIILPFDAISIAIAAWVGAVTFWGSTLLLAWTIGKVRL